MLDCRTACDYAAHIYQKKPPVSSLVPLLPSSPHHIRPLSFPKYTGHTPSNIGGVNNLISDKPVEEKSFSIAHIKKETPFLDLKVNTLKMFKLIGCSCVFDRYRCKVTFLVTLQSFFPAWNRMYLQECQGSFGLERR